MDIFILIISIIAGVATFVFLSLGIALIIRKCMISLVSEIDIKRRGTKTIGTLFDIDRRIHSFQNGASVTYVITYIFQDSQGQYWRSTKTIGRHPQASVGDTVQVHYVPQQPQRNKVALPRVKLR